MTLEKLTLANLTGMLTASLGSMFGWVESHTAIIGLFITSIVAIATILYKRHDIIQRRRANDIAEARLLFDQEQAGIVIKSRRIKQPGAKPK